MAKFDIYQAVTDRIIEQLDNGVIPWHKPWSGIASGAYNTVSNKTYSLLNQMLLKHDGEYATYKQWSELGGQVRKDEESEIVVFWKMIPVEEKVDGEIVKKTIPYLKYINVFHVSQVDGVQPKDKKAVIHEPIKEAEKIIADYDARESITMEDVLGNNAYYAPLRDYLCVPTKEQYSDINKYYSTKFHEMVHSTGLRDRGITSARFYVLRNSRVPATLVETAFITNPYEESMLANVRCQYTMAKAICRGINNYFRDTLR